MSYILDALKKSERERSGVRAGDLPNDNPSDARRNPWPLVIALVLLSNVALGLGWWMWQRMAGNTAATAVAPASVTAPDPEPAPSDTPQPATSAQPAPPAKTSAGDLSAEAPRVPAVPPPARIKAPVPAPTLPVLSSTAPQAAQTPVASAPWLRELPDQFRQSVAPLNVNIHVYTGSSADSVLYINDHQYRAGEHLPNGVQIEAVLVDGAILSYQGQRFKLPRPN